MDMKAKLSLSHSVDIATSVALFAESDESNFKALINIVAGEDPELARRAAWSLGKAGEVRPNWMAKYLPDCILLLQAYSHPAIGRNIYRALQYTQIPRKFHAPLYDLCLLEINDHNKPVAIKIFAMTVAANIVAVNKELTEELKLTIAQNMSYGTAGYKSRARRILRSLE